MASALLVMDEGHGLQGRTVLVVLAHPDDESLACGGTLARLSDAGARVVLLCASHGERGGQGALPIESDADLGERRVLELREAATVLGVADVLVFNHPDGSLRWVNYPAFEGEMLSIIHDCRPDAVITFDEDGLYWHPDHIGIHERTQDVVSSLGDKAPALYYVTMPKGAMREIFDIATAKGWSQPHTGLWGIVPDAFGLLARPPSLTIDVHDWVPRKLAALRCHRSQMGQNNPFTWLDEADARRCLGVEQFRRAQPETGTSLLEPMSHRPEQSKDLRI